MALTAGSAITSVVRREATAGTPAALRRLTAFVVGRDASAASTASGSSWRSRAIPSASPMAAKLGAWARSQPSSVR